MINPAVLGVTRPKFLTLAVLAALVGLAVAVATDPSWSLLSAIVIIVGAIAAHVSVNTFNEIADFESGLDARTQRTPFSGGSGTLVAQPQLLADAKTLARGSLVLTFAIGVWVLFMRGALIVPIGIAGVVLIYFYSTSMQRSALVTLLAPGFAFGPLMVLGAQYSLVGSISAAAVWLAVPVWCWVSNILLLAQVPDVDADASVGRRHWVVVHGRHSAMRVYAYLQLISFAALLLGWALGPLPATVLWLLPLAVPAYLIAQRARERVESLPDYIPLIGAHVALTHVLMLLLVLVL